MIWSLHLLAGSKFGGYGSFLPTYQRSPAIDLRNPPEVHNNNRPRSPNTTHFEVHTSGLFCCIEELICVA